MAVFSRKTVRYRAFRYDEKNKVHFKGQWRNTAKEAAKDLKLCPGASIQKVEMGNPVRITVVKEV